ncbi:MAG: DUF4350 domain-containing protein [Glaciihabitans sp.]
MTVTTDEFAVRTPTLRRTLRRGVFWIAAVAFALIVALITLAVSGSGQPGDPLSPTNPAPTGAQAVAEVLRDEGVTVTATTSLDATRDAVGPGDTTVLLYDPNSLLSADQLDEVGSLATSLVLIEPGFAQLSTLTPDIAAAGTASGPFETDAGDASDDGATAGGCRVDAVERAGSVAGDGSGYRFLGDQATASLCLGSGDDVYSLIRVAAETGTRTVLGIGDVLSNEGVIARGNAALALGLLGENDTLVWYLPSLDDVSTETPPSLAELSPGWVVPLMLLVFLVAIAAAFWRGRRFGPLVVERLPVLVRASETMEGRARLYEKNSARLRALDALRIGAIVRLAGACGLPRTATVDEVVTAVASTINRSPADVRALLRDTEPRTDADLVRLSDELLLLERAVAGVLRPDPPHRPEEKPAHD